MVKKAVAEEWVFAKSDFLDLANFLDLAKFSKLTINFVSITNLYRIHSLYRLFANCWYLQHKSKKSHNLVKALDELSVEVGKV